MENKPLESMSADEVRQHIAELEAQAAQEAAAAKGSPASSTGSDAQLSFENMTKPQLEQYIAKLQGQVSAEASASREAPVAGVSGAPAPADQGVAPYYFNGPVMNTVRGFMPEMLVPQNTRVPALEALPSVATMPEAHSWAGAVALANPFANPGTDEAAQLLVKNIPGLKVETPPGAPGYRVFTFPDGRQYASRPGLRWEDIVGNIPSTLVGVGLGALAAPAKAAQAAAGVGPRAVQALGSLARTVLPSMAQQTAGEATHAAMPGGEFNTGQIGVAGAIPLVIPAARALMSGTAYAVKKLTAPLVRSVEDLAPAITEKIAQLTAGWGANPDIAHVSQKAADISQPRADAAKLAFDTAAADAENAAKAAAASREAAQAVETVRLEDADRAARLAAQTSKTAAVNAGEDAASAVKAKAEEVVAGAADKVRGVMTDMREAVNRWGVSDISTLDRKAIDRWHGILEDSKVRSNTLGGALKRVMPGKTHVYPADIAPAVEWIDKAMSGMSEGVQPEALKKVRDELTSKKLSVATVSRLRQELSDAGWKGPATALGNIQSGEKRALAQHLLNAEVSVAERIPGGVNAAGILDTPGPHTAADIARAMRAEVSSRLSNQDALREASVVRGAKAFRSALKGSIVPASEAAVKGIQQGNVKPLMDLMAATPSNMREGLMSSIIAREMLDNAPEDAAKAAKHIISFVNNLENEKVVGARVFGILGPGAKKTLLNARTQAEEALADLAETKSVAASAAAEAKSALKRGTAQEVQNVGNLKADKLLQEQRASRARLDTVKRDTEAAVSAARAKADYAKNALDNANASNINLSSAMRSAGESIADGNAKPFSDMLKVVDPSMKTEVAASTLHHALVDPAKPGVEGLGRMASVARKIEASPVARAQIFSHLEPGSLQQWRDAAGVLDIVEKGTSAGQKKAETFLEKLRETRAYVGGRFGIVAGAGVGTAATKTGTGTAVGSGIGYVLGRMFLSGLGKNQSVETKAANAALQSPVGRAMLKRLSMDLDIPPGLLQKFGELGPVRFMLKRAGMSPGALTKWLEPAANVGIKRALVPDNPEKE